MNINKLIKKVKLSASSEISKPTTDDDKDLKDKKEVRNANTE